MLKKHLLTYLLLLVSLLGFAQETQDIISGVVTDKATGAPLPGATLLVKGTTHGAITNMDGKFTYKISLSDKYNPVLVVSFLGYISQEITISEEKTYNIELEPNNNLLNEVVVTSSYGTQKLEQEVVGSITNLKPKDLITEQAVTSFDQLLEGQAAGLYIDTREGVGSPVDIHIRGLGTLPASSNVGTSTQPLIIVDGVILAEEINLEENSYFDTSENNGKYSEDPSNPLAKLGIENIETINILKDAAAVSLYGADGANGVIVITTKGGHKGKPRFNLSVQSGISTEMNAIKYLNGEQYNELLNLYYKNIGQKSSMTTWNSINTDWHDLLNDNGSYQKYNFSVSGGSDYLKYRASAAYQNIKEPQIGNTYQKANSNFSITYTKKKFNIDIKIAPSYSEKNNPNTLAEYAIPPTLTAYDEDGNYALVDDSYGNPLAVAHQNRNKTTTWGLFTSSKVSWQFNDNINFSTLFGNDYSDKNQDMFHSGENQTGIFDSLRGERMLRDRITNKWNWNANVSYNKDFGPSHHFDAIIGIETRMAKVNYSYLKGRGFDVYDSPQDPKTANSVSQEEDSSEDTGRSFFSQFNYNYQKKYFLLVNARVDQSSVFGGDNNTALNGGVGISWVLSKEDFLNDVHWLTFLRMRLSYGTTGNSRIGSYSALGLYSYDDEGEDGYNNGSITAKPSDAPNSDLGWEKRNKFNFGIDISTSARISSTIEFFYDDIDDMIISRTAIPESGYSTVQINGADMYNMGIEYSFDATWIAQSKFRWKTNFNISTLKNKVTHLKGLGSKNATATTAMAQKVGYSSSDIWGYKFVGIDPSSGLNLYNIDGRIVDDKTRIEDYSKSSDYEPIGNTEPDFYGGLSNKFTFFKRLSFDISLSYKIGADMLVDDELLDKYQILSYRNISTNAYYGVWREPGDIAYYQALTKNSTVAYSSKYLYSTSHIKLNAVKLSYNIPTSQWRSIQSMRVFANGSNLYYWFFEKNPENQNGIKEFYKTYSEMRTFALGINIGF